MPFLSERRKHPRYSIHLPVFIFHGEKRAGAHTLDLSLGGMRIYAGNAFGSRRDFLFQLVLQRNAIWVKGRLVFEQTEPELMNFACIQFAETTKESNMILQEFLSQPQNALKKECLDIELRVRERENALAKANDLLKLEMGRRNRGEHVLKQLGEQLGYLSSVCSGNREERLRISVQELDTRVEALVMAITNGLEKMNLLLKEGSVPDRTSFEEIIFSIHKNYKQVRKALDNLGPSISEELKALETIGRQCQALYDVYHAFQSEKAENLLFPEGRTGKFALSEFE